MNAQDVVLRKEDDGKANYHRCGAEAGVPELTRIFDMLSQDEGRHAEALRALQQGGRVELPQSPTLDGAKRILRTLSVRQKGLAAFRGDLRRYLFAMEFEATTASVCCELAREAVQGWERDLLLKIAAEDEMHFTVIEHMRELVEAALPEGDDGGCDAR